MNDTGNAARDGDSINRKNAAAKNGMASETKIILTVVGIAVLAFAIYVWGFTKAGVPGYALWLVGGFIAFFTLLTLKSLLPGQEEKLAQRLADGVGKPAVGTVTEMRRRGSLETTTHRYVYVTLALDMEAEGKVSRVSISAKIEENMLADFASGKQVHLLYDPEDPADAAIDRAKSPVSIE
ncbi:DUF3592 domain-containing protein [Pusillimonas noertemannii]|uniref:DUF3592 domain-containing protein n=1 Tax=Pusillimonas noertemannii TaxID=305977 RepID=UPI00036A2B2D|nr:DUF3592 domain-containing protein [Pusillimonas noertemannii]